MNLVRPPDIKKMQAKEDVNGLIKAIDYPKDAKTRMDALVALGDLGLHWYDYHLQNPQLPVSKVFQQIITTFIKATEHPDAPVRQIAEIVLIRWGRFSAWCITTWGYDFHFNPSHKPPSPALFSIMERIGPEAIEPLISMLVLEENTFGQVSALLAKMGPPAAQALIANLAAASGGVHKLEVSTLAMMIRKLEGDLKEKALATIRNTIINWRGQTTETRLAAINAAADLQDLQAIPNLILVSQSQKHPEDLSAVAALGHYKVTEAVSTLVNILFSPDSSLREAAALALTSSEDLSARILSPALVSERHDVRKIATDILIQRNWKPSMDEDGALFWIGQTYWDRCITIGEPSFEPLAQVVETWGDAAVARALGKIDGSRALNVFERILSSGKDDRRAVALDGLDSLAVSLSEDSERKKAIELVRRYRV